MIEIGMSVPFTGLIIFLVLAVSVWVKRKRLIDDTWTDFVIAICAAFVLLFAVSFLQQWSDGRSVNFENHFSIKF